MVVVVLGSAPTPETVALLRRATRASVPVIAVRTGPDEGRIPYVGASETVDVPPGSGFPVDEIADLVARVTGPRAVGLAAALPRLRPFVTHSLVRRAAATTAAIGALPLMPAIHLPVMLRVQQRLVLDLAVVDGRKLDPTERAPELAGTVVAALAARSVARRLPLPRRVTGALTGFAVTRAVGEAARLRFAADPHTP